MPHRLAKNQGQRSISSKERAEINKSVKVKSGQHEISDVYRRLLCVSIPSQKASLRRRTLWRRKYTLRGIASRKTTTATENIHWNHSTAVRHADIPLPVSQIHYSPSFRGTSQNLLNCMYHFSKPHKYSCRAVWVIVQRNRQTNPWNTWPLFGDVERMTACW